MNGTIESITTDWRGDTLATATLTSDTEIAVGDVADFDEDGGWLTIGNSAPMEYVSTNDDAVPVITLAGTVGAAYEAGEPVNEWDPSVMPDGANVVEYVAEVMTDRGSVPAVIPHAVVPLAGVYRLIGASVTLDQEDEDDWFVSQVYGREANVDQSYIGIPYINLYLPANQTVASSGTTYATLTNWTVRSSAESDLFVVNTSTGEVTLNEDGFYGFFPISAWVGNSSGRRYIRLVTNYGGVDEILRTIPGSPPDATTYSQQIGMGWPILAGTKVRVEVLQDSGASLDVRGGVGGLLTQLQIVRWQA